MVNTLFLPELREMLAENNTFELREFCTALHPARTAEFMEGLDAGDAWRVLQHADLKLREDIFRFFPHEKQVEVIESQDRAEVAELLADLPADDRVDLLQDVRPEVVEELLPLLRRARPFVGKIVSRAGEGVERRHMPPHRRGHENRRHREVLVVRSGGVLA